LAEALEVAIETLYDGLGGTDAITAVVDDFLTRCAADDHGERLTVARGHEHTRSSNHGGDLGRVLTSSPGSR
jgi:truncated hemoglobin YjbI